MIANTYWSHGAKRALRRQQGVPVISKYKDLDIIHRPWGNKLIISRSRICLISIWFGRQHTWLSRYRSIGKWVHSTGTWAGFYVYGDAINQSSFNQPEDSNLSTNQVRGPWIDWLIDSKSASSHHLLQHLHTWYRTSAHEPCLFRKPNWRKFYIPQESSSLKIHGCEI